MKNYHIVQKNLSAKIIKRSSELLKIPKTFSRKKISRDQWRIFKIKKKKIPPNEVSASKRINFHPDGRALDGPNPPSFPVSYSPPSQEAAPVAFERCTARKSSRGWLEKAASFQVFPLGAYSPRPSHPRASLVTRKNKRDQLAASRLKSENWEGRGEGGRRLAERIFCAFRKRLLSFFFFSFQRNVIGCSLARGNFMKLPTQAPDFWPGSSFTKIWNSIIREEIWSLVISLIKFSRETSREINYLERVGSWSFLFANISEKNKRIITW